MNSSSCLAGCHSPFSGVRLRDVSLPCSSVKQSGLYRHGRTQQYVRGAISQRHEKRAVELSCLIAKDRRKFQHVARVGSFLRSLEQEEDTERAERYEDIRFYDDAVARGELTDVPPAASTSKPLHVDEEPADDRNGRTPIAGERSRSLGSLLDSGDWIRSDAVLQGFDALQLVEKDDEASSEVSLWTSSFLIRS